MKPVKIQGVLKLTISPSCYFLSIFGLPEWAVKPLSKEVFLLVFRESPKREDLGGPILQYGQIERNEPPKGDVGGGGCGKEGIKGNLWHLFNINVSLLIYNLLIPALPLSTACCSHCACSVISNYSLSVLFYCLPIVEFTSALSSVNDLSLHHIFLLLLCPFVSFRLFNLFCFSIQTAREKYSCVMNATKYLRFPTSTKPSLPKSNPLWVPGLFALLNPHLALNFPIRWPCFIFCRGNGSS